MDALLTDIGYPCRGQAPMTRHELGRETFMKLGWAWRARYGRIITEQHRRLGASCDWDASALHGSGSPAPCVPPSCSSTRRAHLPRQAHDQTGARGAAPVSATWRPNTPTRTPGCGTCATRWNRCRRRRQGGVHHGGHHPAETILGDTAVAVTPATSATPRWWAARLSAGPGRLIPSLPMPPWTRPLAPVR